MSGLPSLLSELCQRLDVAPARRSAQSMIATGGSIREPAAARFLRLTEDENQMEVDKTS
jgi:hypothetical protein